MFAADKWSYTKLKRKKFRKILDKVQNPSQCLKSDTADNRYMKNCKKLPQTKGIESTHYLFAYLALKLIQS